MDNKKKKKKFFDFQMYMIIVLALAIVGYGCYYMKEDKISFDSNGVNASSILGVSNKNNQKLDANNRAIIDLYNKVVSSISDYKYWMYNDYSSDYNIDNDIILSKENSIIKMNIVGSNVDTDKQQVINCDTKFENIKDDSRSVCFNNLVSKTDFEEVGYKKNYIESIYHEIFGDDSTFDTSIPMHLEPNTDEVYYYIESLDMYVKYFGEYTELDETKYDSKIDQAIRNKDEIEIYEKVMDNDEVIGEYIYTFKVKGLDCYFVGRKKKEA